MRKLLKLAAIGALLAVGPIQAFAVPVTPNQTPSDELRISNSSGVLVDFFFFDPGNDTGNSNSEPENSQSELLLDSPPSIGTPPTVWNGGEHAYLVTLNNVTNRTDTSFSNYFLNLTEGVGSDVSDTLWANFKSTDSIGIYSVDIYFFDGPPWFRR